MAVSSQCKAWTISQVNWIVKAALSNNKGTAPTASRFARPYLFFYSKEAVMYVELLSAVRWVSELIKLFIDQIPA
ncbi:MAG: hypothetical protein DHS20C16_32000 [Phycisphaerae bacterium]|nr:MAG: hypothetical protein DHS20C16_32000 [Phycisphaerae bacterium]